MPTFKFTPKDIYEADFSTKMRGYDKEEVDELLDVFSLAMPLGPNTACSKRLIRLSKSKLLGLRISTFGLLERA